MRKRVKQILFLSLIALLFTACGGEDRGQNQAQQQTPPRVNIPLAEDQSPAPDAQEDAGIAPAEELPEGTIPDLSGLKDVEKELFVKTIKVQVPYYEALGAWADAANTVQDGNAAAASLRRYIALQESFARQMQKLDASFSGRLDPNYAGSAEFQRVLDVYMNDPDLLRRTEHIMKAYMGLIQRFRDDPACKEVFADIERMAREAQTEQ